MERKRIVVKIGSSSLTNAKGEIDKQKFMDHIQAIAKLKQLGHDILLVSSGAVAAGFRMLGYSSRPVTIKGKQAAAAVGQSLLIGRYTEAFSKYGIIPAQILLTRHDFSEKKRYKNAYATFAELLDRSILPIINENDTVSVTELTFGDNDMLSALVSGLVHADHLIILTDVNGLYDANPLKNREAKRIDRIAEITDEMLGFASGTASKVGTGGMQSKLIAARYAMNAGVKVFIGNGTGENKLTAILEGHGDGTYVESESCSILPMNKQWLTLTEVSGKLFIDDGAVKAITTGGKSLLPAGIYAFEGHFEKGDVVEVYDRHILIGRGETLYSSDLLEKAMGKRTGETDCPIEVVIHRNNWVEV
ncbi:glutamate 5-kinase [Lysinibacillus odysseyi]|uniref:Glutamate 5-kinase n=1 Tax=Lysinibacillus odysseyi 34hs-1 = NBRC 100172 TaxID=1220589 RepID=A0A0A3J3Y1_9BACI|nr:glutamate 5-kinase [Lysinibacillus odysseyi]KGR81747.1 gamma-glutamyl kinase [Lysinibacillus odysseyi 34hs-1 = NBRC 100172]